MPDAHLELVLTRPVELEIVLGPDNGALPLPDGVDWTSGILMTGAPALALLEDVDENEEAQDEEQAEPGRPRRRRCRRLLSSTRSSRR